MKPNKALMVMLVLPVAALLLFAAAQKAFAQEEESLYQWKVGTLAPKGVGWARQVEEIVLPAVSESSQGNLTLKIYWGGVMGDDAAILERMREDILQSAGLTAVGSVMACPDFAVLGLPFLLQDWDEVDHIRDVMFEDFASSALKNGFELYLWVDQDFDQLYSVNRPLVKPSDFADAKIITWHDQLERSLISRLGATPVPRSIPDIREAVRSGEAEAVIAPAIWIVGTQLYSTVRFVTPVKLRYSPAIIAVTQKAWNELPEAYRKKAYELRPGVTRQFVTHTRRDNEKSVVAMLRYGVQAAPMDEMDIITLKHRTAPLWSGMAGQLYSQELLDKVLGVLAEFRAGR
ncbi:MAG: TRAP transporter substrate-binding protein DctP [Desulfatibacillaceae bacterium]|nr:TRAP transporter substrate-binding protein DctP [Desulfatibacillaceae bacterium]